MEKGDIVVDGMGDGNDGEDIIRNSRNIVDNT